jgi:hypothetical protein
MPSSTIMVSKVVLSVRLTGPVSHITSPLRTMMYLYSSEKPEWIRAWPDHIGYCPSFVSNLKPLSVFQ